MKDRYQAKFSARVRGGRRRHVEKEPSESYWAEEEMRRRSHRTPLWVHRRMVLCGVAFVEKCGCGRWGLQRR